MFENLVLMIIMYNTLLLGLADYGKDSLVTVEGEYSRALGRAGPRRFGSGCVG